MPEIALDRAKEMVLPRSLQMGGVQGALSEVDKGLLDRPASPSKRGNLTLVFAARDVERNSAAVLLELLQNEGGAEGR